MIKWDYSGSRLTERRYEARLTQEDLAELVGVSKQTVGFWEQGRRYPTLTHVAKLQEVLYEELRRVRAREQALRLATKLYIPPRPYYHLRPFRPRP